MKSKILLFGALLLLTGCSKYNYSPQTLMSINPGMNKDQVLQLLGTPQYRRFDQNAEEWEYNSFYKAVIISFTDGKVSGMDSFDIPASVQPVAPQPVIIEKPSHGIHNLQRMKATDQEVVEICAQIDKESFKNDKFKLLEAASNNKLFTCKQCVRLTRFISFGDEKIQAIKILKPCIIDCENYKVLSETVSYGYRQQAEDLLLSKKQSR